MFESPEDRRLQRQLVESVFATLIEDGQIDVVDRPIADILGDFLSWAKAELGVPKDELDADDNGPKFQVVVDHRQWLRRDANEAASARPEVAIVLYATWIEHSLNGLILKAFNRVGVTESSTKALLRSVNLDPKIEALWEVAGLPELEQGLKKKIRSIASLRNEFVHYKWSPQPDDLAARRSKDRYKSVAEQCEQVANALEVIEQEFLWAGRRGEILSAFQTEFWEPDPEAADQLGERAP